MSEELVTKSIPEQLEELLAAKERQIQQYNIQINDLLNRNQQLVIQEAYLKRSQNERESLIVDGYIRKIAISISLSQTIPIEIYHICFAFYFSTSNVRSATEALAALLGGRKKKPTVHNRRQQLFKNYNMMLRIGLYDIHMAINRMRSDGVNVADINEFKNRYCTRTGYEFPEDPIDYGLVPKKHVIIGKGITMQRLQWTPVQLKHIENSIWHHMESIKIQYDSKHFELHFKVPKRPQIARELSDNMSIRNTYFKEIDEKEDAKKTFVSEKRSAQVLIGLRKLKLSIKQIRD
eukprot:124233_1